MADVGEMEMPLPENALPMMSGTGPFAPIEMGGLFSARNSGRANRSDMAGIEWERGAHGRTECLAHRGIDESKCDQTTCTASF
jgi:hypothetical protein